MLLFHAASAKHILSVREPCLTSYQASVHISSWKPAELSVIAAMLLVVAFVALLALVAYVGFVIHKKEINPKHIRLHSVEDVKKLLTLPSTAGPQKYLAKRA